MNLLLKLLPLAAIFAGTAGCGKPNTAQADAESRNARFEATRIYVARHYPAYVVKSQFKDVEDYGADGEKRTCYYVMIANPKDERSVYLCFGAFELVDGTRQLTAFEPSASTRKAIADQKAIINDRNETDELKAADEEQ